MPDEQRHQFVLHRFANFIGENISRFLAGLGDPGKLRKLARLCALICLGVIVLIWAIFGSTLRYKVVSRKAQTLLNHDRIEEAISRFQAAAKIKPKSADAHNNLGVALSEKPERLNEAVAELQKAVELNPDHPTAYAHIGDILFEKGETNQAITNYRKQLEIGPNDAAVRFRLGRALQKTGKLDDAIAEFRKGIEIEPRASGAHYQLANSLLQKGLSNEAIAHYEVALKKRTDNADIHKHLAVALSQNGHTFDAIMHWQKAIELRPDNVEARGELALVLWRTQQKNDAIAQWQKITEVRPDNIEARINLAWVLATSPDDSIRNGAKAVAFAEQARKLAGDENPDIFHSLAAALAECGRFTEAIAAAQQSLTLATAQNQSELIQNLETEIALYRINLPRRDKREHGAAWP